MRVWLETAGPPAWKGANDEKVYFFRLRLNPSIQIQVFCFVVVLEPLTPHDEFL
jgi:hypothetical protein